MFFQSTIIVMQCFQSTLYVLQPNTIKMSSNINNTDSSSSSKPFCKVCKDAGCSERDYTSHFVKDQPGPKGKVVCPTLLNQSCRICNQRGHTSSYCKQYKPRPSREEPRDYRREEPRHQEYSREEYRRDDYRREEPRDYRREEPRDYRREEPRHQEYSRDDYRRDEPREYRRDDYRRDEPREYRRDDYRREEPREYRREEPREYRRDDYRREEPREYRREEPRHQHRAPYAHPHGPRVRLQLESPALSANASAPAPATAPLFEMPPWGTPEYWKMFQTDDTAASAKRVVIVGDDEDLSRLPVTEIDVLKVDLNAEPVWSDEPLVNMDAEHRRILEDEFMKCLISDKDFDLIVAADEDNMDRFGRNN